MDEQTLISGILANAKKGSQIPEQLQLNPENYLFTYVTGVGFRLVKKSNIVFPGEPISTLTGLSDTPNQILGQAGKILVVKPDEKGFEYRVLAEVTGVTEQQLNDAIATSLLSEPFTYTSGAQDFVVTNPIAQIYSVLVGNSSLQRTQYTHTGSTVTITDTLTTGAVIEINYTKL